MPDDIAELIKKALARIEDKVDKNTTTVNRLQGGFAILVAVVLAAVLTR